MAAAEEGVIVCQLGTRVNASAMPEVIKEALIGAFDKVPKSRIYWQMSSWGDQPIFNYSVGQLPQNINVSTFLPQNDLLGKLL